MPSDLTVGQPAANDGAVLPFVAAAPLAVAAVAEAATDLATQHTDTGLATPELSAPQAQPVLAPVETFSHSPAPTHAQVDPEPIETTADVEPPFVAPVETLIEAGPVEAAEPAPAPEPSASAPVPAWTPAPVDDASWVQVETVPGDEAEADGEGQGEPRPVADDTASRSG